MSNDQAGEYYTAERWQNWLRRLRDANLDPEEEESVRLLWNLQDDTAIAVAKILADFEDGPLDEEAALTELVDMHEIVFTEEAFDDEATAMLVEGAQRSLECVLYAAQEFVTEGPAEGTVPEYIEAAAGAEADDDLDAALGYCVQAGTLVIDNQTLDHDLTENLEFGFVTEWVNGLDSLQRAMSEPEFVEEE
jgi:hypothetical protein